MSATKCILKTQQSIPDPFGGIQENVWFIVRVNQSPTLNWLCYIERRLADGDRVSRVVYMNPNNGALCYSDYDYLKRHYTIVYGHHKFEMSIQT